MGRALDTHGSEAVPVGRRLGWGSSHHCLCSAKCAHRLPAKRGLCCLPAACWLTHCLSTFLLGLPFPSMLVTSPVAWNSPKLGWPWGATRGF